jgi:toxin ParE1/3/4
MGRRKQVYCTAQARSDLVEIACLIVRDKSSAAMRFLDAAESTFKTLARSPELGSRGEFRSAHLADIQRWRVKGFENYLIFYCAIADGIQVVRILHGARDIEAIFNDSS